MNVAENAAKTRGLKSSSINPIGHAEDRRAIARAVSYPKERGSTRVSDARNRSANRSHREPDQKPALCINAALIFGRKSSTVSRNPIAQGGEIARVVKNSSAQVLDKLVRLERLLAATPLVLRCAPDRRRATRGSVQPGADAGLSNSACCLPGVRITTSNGRAPKRVLRHGKLWCARRDSNSRPPGS